MDDHQQDSPTHAFTPTPPRRWFQFRLKWLLVFITILAAPLSWLGWKLEEKRRERWAEAEIQRLGGVIFNDGPLCGFDADPPPGPEWLRRLLGDDFFVHTTLVIFEPYTVITDDRFIYLQGLPKLRGLDLTRCSVNDASLFHLRKVRSLEVVDLKGSHVSPRGIAALQKALPQCRIIHESQPK